MATLSQPTLSALLKETRIMLNQPEASNSFWTDAELGGFLNDAVRLYFQEIAQRAEGQFDAQVDLNIVANVETIALPTDCFEVKAVYKLQNSSNYVILTYRNNITEGYDTQSNSSNGGYEPYYYFRGNNLVLRPVPTFNETASIRLEYISFPSELIIGSDVMSSGISPVFKELVVMYAVWKAKVKESLVTGTNTYNGAAEILGNIYKKFTESVGYRSKYPQMIRPFNP